MLGFVVPINSRKISKSWDNLSLLFERTAKSMCNHTHPDFRMIVVCQYQPHIKFEHPNLQYLTVDLGLPVPIILLEVIYMMSQKPR
ncbi:MAG: hypothetical protein KFF72_09060 [Arthrospira sp. SH-MAG29]|nr:hypothetical protein [Arthrospira sp. SH-MAG29]MBS0016492.1 hypothetical protein [Arthrospira sp. SH-MAG29]